MGGPGDQFHDFNPGIKPSGLFWTVAFDPSTFDSIPGQGRARFKVPNMAMPDYHDIFNAVLGGSSVPGHVAFEVTWAGGGAHTKIRDETFDYGGDFIGGPATITFTVSVDGDSAVYTADAAGQNNGDLIAGVGHERNGVFFQ